MTAALKHNTATLQEAAWWEGVCIKNGTKQLFMKYLIGQRISLSTPRKAAAGLQPTEPNKS